jgi:hypothetical protein
MDGAPSTAKRTLFELFDKRAEMWPFDWCSTRCCQGIGLTPNSTHLKRSPNAVAISTGVKLQCP